MARIRNFVQMRIALLPAICILAAGCSGADDNEKAVYGKDTGVLMIKADWMARRGCIANAVFVYGSYRVFTTRKRAAVAALRQLFGLVPF